MIDKRELMGLHSRWRLTADVIQKDYVLGWLLAGISRHPVLASAWVFKGGTCLRKCYFETFRFSEDLDFTALSGAPTEPGELVAMFEDVGAWATRTPASSCASTTHPSGSAGTSIRAEPWYRLSVWADTPRRGEDRLDAVRRLLVAAGMGGIRIQDERNRVAWLATAGDILDAGFSSGWPRLEIPVRLRNTTRSCCPSLTGNS